MADIELTITVDEADARAIAEDYADGRPSNRIVRIARAFEAALPKPRPAEPMGLGAVVRDGDGRVWVRIDHNSDPWRQSNVLRWRNYANLPDPIEVLSEGVIL